MSIRLWKVTGITQEFTKNKTMTCDKNPEKITKMFDEISSYYDNMNNFISLGTHYLIKKTALKNLKIGANSYVLDLCCGTGDFTRILGQIAPKSKVIGLDNSKEMLKLAKTKNPQKAFMQGDCTALPFGENEFDYITVGFGLRNVENRKKAISEIYRTLKHGGKFLHLDFGRHGFVDKCFDFIVPLFVKILGISSENYSYLLKSKNEYPQPDELIKEFETQGFRFVRQQDFFFGAISYQIMQK